MSIEIRQATLADRQAIEKFIGSAYGDLAAYKGPDRWHWQFLANPFSKSVNEFVPVWIALDKSVVVGQVAVQSIELNVHGKTHSAGWLVDVMVSPDYRGKGLGHLLYSAVAKDVPVLLTLTMAPATRRMAERCGAVELGHTYQLSRWDILTANDIRRYLLHRTAHRPVFFTIAKMACQYATLDRLSALVLGLYLRIRNRQRRSMPSRLEMKEVASFGSEVDALWETVRADYSAICPRNSVFLNWRFVDCPKLHYRRFLAYHHQQLVGYSVLRSSEPEELRQGIIVDVLSARRDQWVFEDLISHALEFFGGQVASVECGTSVPEIRLVLQKAGFHITRTHSPTLVTSDAKLRAELVSRQTDCFFSKADHDWDQINLA